MVGIITLKIINAKKLLLALTVAKMWTKMDLLWQVVITVLLIVKLVALRLVIQVVRRKK
jgi:hypothetical protein